MIIRLKNMRLLAIIGVNSWERTERQAVVVNAEIEFDGSRAAVTDSLEDTLDYRTISKKIVQLVETSEFFLVEKLADQILKSVLDTPKVLRARVEVDKPFAIKCAESTSVEVSGSN